MVQTKRSAGKGERTEHLEAMAEQTASPREAEVAKTKLAKARETLKAAEAAAGLSPETQEGLLTKRERDAMRTGRRGPLPLDDGRRWVADAELTDAILSGINAKGGPSPEPFRKLLAKRMQDPAFAARYREAYPDA